MKWIKEDDRDTKYFQLTSIQRRQLNQIGRLKVGTYYWITNEEGIRELAVRHFESVLKWELIRM